MNDNPETMSDEELEDNLITLDFRGKAFKKRCLDALLKRKRKQELIPKNEVALEGRDF